MMHFSVIEAPSILGLKPTGVETLPEALKNAGLIQGLQADYASRVEVPPYNPERDNSTLHPADDQEVRLFGIDFIRNPRVDTPTFALGQIKPAIKDRKSTAQVWFLMNRNAQVFMRSWRRNQA